MKNNLFSKATLALSLILTAAAVVFCSFADADQSTVNPQITDAVTQTNVKILGTAPSPTLERKLVALPNALSASKIGQSDTPDTMLSLLTALRSANQYVGALSSDVPDNLLSAVEAESHTLLTWIHANPGENAAVEKLEQTDLMPALNEVLFNSN